MLDVDSLIKATRERVFLSFSKVYYKWMALPHTSSGFTVQKLSIGYAALFPKKTPARKKRQSSNSLLSTNSKKCFYRKAKTVEQNYQIKEKQQFITNYLQYLPHFWEFVVSQACSLGM